MVKNKDTFSIVKAHARERKAANQGYVLAYKFLMEFFLGSFKLSQNLLMKPS